MEINKMSVVYELVLLDKIKIFGIICNGHKERIGTYGNRRLIFGKIPCSNIFQAVRTMDFKQRVQAAVISQKKYILPACFK